MICNALRKELAALMPAPPDGRMPVIRRSLRPEWLYAADLDILYGGTIPNMPETALAGAGWEFAREGNWLQLRKPAPEPPEDWYCGPFGPEAACCASLLERCRLPREPELHVQLMLIKAGEEGEKAYEKTCSEIHREWAARLRQGWPLPDLSERYFGL